MIQPSSKVGIRVLVCESKSPLPHRPAAQLAAPYKEAPGLLKLPEAAQDSGNVSENGHSNGSDNRPVECGLGSLMGVETGTLRRRGESQGHQQLGGAVRGTPGLCFVLGHSPERGLEKTAPEKGCV